MSIPTPILPDPLSPEAIWRHQMIQYTIGLLITGLITITSTVGMVWLNHIDNKVSNVQQKQDDIKKAVAP